MILSIETSIKNGSLALLLENGEIDEWCGSGEVSRSVDLIVQIGEILRRNCSDKRELKKILVSRGPGSFTGLRVGISTAMGLSMALGCAVGGISILRAMAEFYKNQESVLSLVSAGRGLFFWQNFDFAFENDVAGAAKQERKISRGASEISTGTVETLRGAQSGKNLSQIIITSEAFADLTNSDGGRDFLRKQQYVVSEENTATMIVRLCESNPSLFEREIEPLYVRAAIVAGK